ncbi:MAG: hypothetical protein KAS32_04545 [Candidatus Peribacteraceae bacterium]|nr:hypothetical protein [Candidatus Peribacteraceae bacterium]
MNRTRADHIAWCQMRALEYVDSNNPHNAVASMMSDVRKHDETKDHIGVMLGLTLINGGSNEDVRKWIEGFN